MRSFTGTVDAVIEPCQVLSTHCAIVTCELCKCSWMTTLQLYWNNRNKPNRFYRLQLLIIFTTHICQKIVKLMCVWTMYNTETRIIKQNRMFHPFHSCYLFPLMHANNYYVLVKTNDVNLCLQLTSGNLKVNKQTRIKVRVLFRCEIILYWNNKTEPISMFCDSGQRAFAWICEIPYWRQIRKQLLLYSRKCNHVILLKQYPSCCWSLVADN